MNRISPCCALGPNLRTQQSTSVARPLRSMTSKTEKMMAFAPVSTTSPFVRYSGLCHGSACISPRRPSTQSVPRFTLLAAGHDIKTIITEPSPESTPLRTPLLRRPLDIIVDLIRRNSGNLISSPKYGPVYNTRFMGNDITIISDLKAIAAIYKENEIFASSDGAWPKTMETLFGPKTVFITDGVKHAEKRAVVQTAFTPTLIRNYFEPTIESTYELWDDVSEEIERRGSAELLSLMKDHFLRIIIRITTGLELNQGNKETFFRLRDLYLQFEGGLFTFAFGPLWRRALRAREELLKFYEEIIEERLVRDAEAIEKLRASGDDISRAALGDMKGGVMDILTVSIARSPLKTGPDQEHDPVDIKEVAELMLVLWFAGYSTQATAASACVMELGFDESIEKRLMSEQDELMRAAGTKELDISQVLKGMPLLDSYISEILRLYPAVATMPRRVTRDTMVCGHLLKKGTRVGLDSWWAQRDPKYFEDGNVLKMDRFIGRDAPMTVSFGAKGGAHYCIGAALARVNLKVTLGILLRDYEFDLDAKQSRRYVSIPAVQPASGVKIVKCVRKEILED